MYSVALRILISNSDKNNYVSTAAQPTKLPFKNISSP